MEMHVQAKEEKTAISIKFIQINLRYFPLGKNKPGQIKSIYEILLLHSSESKQAP